MTPESSRTSQGAALRRDSPRIAFDGEAKIVEAPSRVGSPNNIPRHGRRSSKGAPVTPQNFGDQGPRHASTTSSNGSSGTEKLKLGAGGGKKHRSVANKTSTRSLPVFRNGGCRPRIYWPTKPPGQLTSEVTFVPRRDYPSDIYSGDPNSSLVGRSDKSFVYAGLFHDHEGHHEWLAVKVISCHPVNDRDRLASAQKEYELLQSLEHNHVIAVVGAYHDSSGERESWATLLYPLAPHDLIEYMGELSEHNHRRLESEDWRPGEQSKSLLSFFPCLCRALLYLHSKLIKHRDIKPGNILVDRFGTVMLTDLDISKHYSSIQKASTNTIGSCTYQYAPAKVSAGEPLGFSRDITSLGFVFLEMATVIFGETNENMFHHLTKGEKCPSCWNPDLHGVCPKSYVDGRGVAANVTPKTLVYSKALERKLIAKWVLHLKDIPRQHPEHIPEGFHSPDGLCTDRTDQFLDMIVAMMEEPDRAQHTLLRRAWQLFDELNVRGEKCKHCHPEITRYGIVDDHVQSNRGDSPPIPSSSTRQSWLEPGIPIPSPTSTPHATVVPNKLAGGLPVPFPDSPLTEDNESTHSSLTMKGPEVLIRSPTGFGDNGDSNGTPARNGFLAQPVCLDSRNEGSAEPDGHEAHMPEDKLELAHPSTQSHTNRPPGSIAAEGIASPDPLSDKPILRAWSYRNGVWQSKVIPEIMTPRIIVYAPSDELIEVKPRSYIRGKEGYLIRLPRRHRTEIAIPKGERLNLKNRLGFWDNLKWKLNVLQWLFVRGTFRREDVEPDLFTPVLH